MRRKKNASLSPAAIRERQRQDALRGAEASADFLRESGAASGLTLAGAAPLVFQGMCRRRGIRVYFTDTPRTDGQSIWLGPVDLANPLAAVFCYGHGVHELHHIRYTDFATVRTLESVPLRELTNVFEDIRIDRLGAHDYEGYLLWRRALFKAYVSSGQAPWRRTGALPAPVLLTKAILFHLEVSVLGLELLADDAAHLLAEAKRSFGDACMDAIVAKAETVLTLRSTADAVRLAREILAVLGEFGERAMERFRSYRDNEPAESESLERVGSEDAQGSLFGLGGEVMPEAMPRAIRPGYASAKKEAGAFARLCDEAAWLNASDHISVIRELMSARTSGGHDQSVGMQSRAYAKPEAYFQHNPKEALGAKRAFYDAWRRSGSLRHLFQTALEHPLPRPAGLGVSGFELDDGALALMAAGENRLFRKPLLLRGRETAVEILLDTSGSMTDQQIAVAKTAACRLLESLRCSKGFAAAMGLFPGATSRSVTPVADWHASVRDAAGRLDFVTGYGTTPILEALFWAACELESRPEEKKVVFVITDGYFPDHEVKVMLDDLSAEGILVVMVGIGQGSTPRGDITDKVRFVEDLPRAMAGLVAKLSRRLRLG